MRTTIEVHRSPLSMFLITLGAVSALILSGASGYLLKGTPARSSSPLTVPVVGSPVATPRPTSEPVAVDPVTGYAFGSVDDQRILAFLKQSGYEGGGTAVMAVDPITGYPSGSVDDQRLLTFLKESGYEGGGTVVQRVSVGSAHP
jgi:hypothetical protein